MDTTPLTNPYNVPPDQGPSAFAGRLPAFARLNQRLADPANTEAVLYIGRRFVGKTALLRHLNTVLDETFVGVYIPLDEAATVDEMEWLLTLARGATAEAAMRGFTLTRLSALEPPLSDVRGWLADRFLPEMLAVVRPHRRLVFLLDDAQVLLDAIAAGRLPDDTFAFLRQLLDRFRQLDVVLTLDSAREGEINRMYPLISLPSLFRLATLSHEETAELLQGPVNGLYRVADTSVMAAHQLTGGWPLLLQRLGDTLFRRWEAEPDVTGVTPNTIKSLSAGLAQYAAPYYEQVWDARSANEQLTLTAITHLHYDDPLGKIDVPAIVGWLVETEFPLDATAISAAVRSLEYDELLTSTPAGLAIRAGLMQNWLLENTRVPSAVTRAPEPASASAAPRNPLPMIVLAVVLLLVGIAVLVSVSNTPRDDLGPTIAPTVTLAEIE